MNTPSGTPASANRPSAATEAGVLPANAYFTITVDGNGQVTFAQNQNIWHGNTGSNDDLANLITAANTLVLQQTVTDQDGDKVVSDLDLSGGAFAIADDGPVAGTLTGVAAPMPAANVDTDKSIPARFLKSIHVQST